MPMSIITRGAIAEDRRPFRAARSLRRLRHRSGGPADHVGAARRGRIPAVPPEEIARILAPHPLFARFDRTRCWPLRRSAASPPTHAGATIMREGDPGSFALVILEGEVDVFVELPAGPGPHGDGRTQPGHRRARRLHRHAAHRDRDRPHLSRRRPHRPGQPDAAQRRIPVDRRRDHPRTRRPARAHEPLARLSDLCGGSARAATSTTRPCSTS